MRQRVHIIRPFTILQIPSLEKWLETQAASGYKLICTKGFQFTFEESQEKKRTYFVYKSPLFLRQDTFLNEFNTAKQRYALRKSMINEAVCDIFEIDQEKVDTYFEFYFFSRIRHYMQYYRTTFFVSLAFLLFFVILAWLENNIFLVLGLAFVLLMFYSLLCLVILRCQLAHLKKQDRLTIRRKNGISKRYMKKESRLGKLDG